MEIKKKRYSTLPPPPYLLIFNTLQNKGLWFDARHGTLRENAKKTFKKILFFLAHDVCICNMLTSYSLVLPNKFKVSLLHFASYNFLLRLSNQFHLFIIFNRLNQGLSGHLRKGRNVKKLQGYFYYWRFLLGGLRKPGHPSQKKYIQPFNEPIKNFSVKKNLIGCR